jgi:hypothetical protein
MITLNSYIEKVKGQLETSNNSGNGKVQLAIMDIVKKGIKEEKPITIKQLASELKKTTQQIHQTIKHSKLIKKVKVDKNRVIVVLSEMK